MRTEFDKSELRAQARDMTIAEIADEHGISYNAARNALQRRGLKAVVAVKDYRSEVARMTESEAVEYLLDCIEALTQVETVDVEPWGLTRTELRVFGCLSSHAGRPVTKESIYNAMYFDRRASDDLPAPKCVDIYVYKVRQKIPQSAGQIRTVRPLGYQWEPAK